MTTVVLDISHRKIVTDSRTTGNRKNYLSVSVLKKSFNLPFFRYKECVSTDSTIKSLRIVKNGFTEFIVGSGYVSEINKFIENYKNDTIPKKFLKDSTVLVAYFNGTQWMVKSFSNSNCILYGEDTEWVVSGSGGQYAAATLDLINQENKNRAIKAVEIAIGRDTYSGGEIRELKLQDYCDIY